MKTQTIIWLFAAFMVVWIGAVWLLLPLLAAGV
jgi:hypothetical protein